MSNVITIGPNIQLDTSGSGMIKFNSTPNIVYPKQNQFWFGDPSGSWIDVSCGKINSTNINATTFTSSGDICGNKIRTNTSDVCGNLNVTGNIYLNGVAVSSGEISGKANLAGGNTFTGGDQIIQGGDVNLNTGYKFMSLILIFRSKSSITAPRSDSSILNFLT